MPKLDTDYVREQFPAFSDPLSSKWSFFENAGGSYVPSNVIERLNHFMTSTKVQPYAEFDTSAIAGDNMDKATNFFAEMINADNDEIIIGGSTTMNMYVLSNAMKSLLKPGDEVILPSPFWTTYPECIKLAGGKAIEVFADESQNYLVSVEQLEAARTPKTKALLFCSPSNPTGSVYSPEQVKAIGEWALKNKVWIIADEIYEHLLYDGAKAPSMPVVVPGLADSTIIINGVAKTYAMTGWRVGWMIGPKDVIKAATNLQSHLTSNVSNVSQRAAIAALTGDLSAVHKMGEAFDRRRKLIVGLLNEIPGFECPMPTGAFYVYPSVKGALGKTIRGKVAKTSAELATIILDEVEVAAVPGEAFGPSGYLRFSYALGDEDIVEGIGRIKKLITEG